MKTISSYKNIIISEHTPVWSTAVYLQEHNLLPGMICSSAFSTSLKAPGLLLESKTK